VNLLFIFKRLKRRYGPQHWWPAKTPFEVIVGAILTQNASWENAARAIQNLRSKKILSFSAMKKADTAALSSAIRPAGYFNVKARRLKNFIGFLDKEYSGDVGRLFREDLLGLREKLLGVNGIGPETADSIILYAAGKPIFVVDAYTKRVFSRLGFVKETASYGEIQDYFMKRLPRKAELFNEYHALIVEHAKRSCRSKPLCASCVLSSSCAYAASLNFSVTSL